MKPRSLIVLALLAATAGAQEQTPPPPCTQENAAQFDFWVGSWEVRRTADDKLMGLDSIRKTLDGCVLEQHWRQQTADFKPAGSPNRLVGRSFSVHNPSGQGAEWNQVWLDNGGSFLTLEGEFKDGKMELQSTNNPRGILRWTWVPGPDGTIHNYGSYSRDQGESWTEYFNITYYPVNHDISAAAGSSE